MKNRVNRLSFPMLLSCLGMAASLFAQSSSLPTPVGWWAFDEGFGTTAADSSGNGYNATLYNGASWTTGKTGSAIVADGSNQYVSIPAIDLSGTQAITWAAWINRTYSRDIVHAMLEDSADYNASTTGFGFFPDGDAASGCSGLAIGIHGDAGYTTSCFAQPSSGIWHHVAFVLDKSQAGTQAISLYIDGQKQTATGQSYATTNTNGFGNNPLYLFSRGGSQYFTAGMVDDLRLYAQALSADQVLQIYQQDLTSLVSLTVTPATSSIVGGTTRQLSALGTFSDGSTQDLTASVAWSSSNTSVATIASSGLATAIAAGNTTIQATSGTVSNSAALTVTAPILVSLSVAPSSAYTTIDGSQQFSATGTYDSGATQNLTANVAWNTTNSAIASVNATGMATGIAYGSTAIQASLGSIIGSANLTVQSASLQSIAIAPAKSQVAVSAQLQLTATGTYSDGSTQDITSQVVWSADDATVASISSSGLVIGIGMGNTTLRASINAINGSTALIVTPSGLVGWWAFDEGSGTTAADSSGNGYNATLYNGASWTAGQTDGAISANGINQYIATPPINLSSTHAFTLAAWVSRTWLNSGFNALIEASANYNNTSSGFAFFVDDSSDCGISSAILIGVHGSGGYALNCYAPPASGGWHHLAVVCDKSQPGNQQVSFYIDGIPQISVSSPYATTNYDTFGNQPFYFFSRSGVQYFSAGMVSDLRLYNRALTAAEIEAIYGLGATSAALQSMAVTPVDSAIVAGNVEQFTATGTYSDGSTRNLTSSVAWASSNAAVASIVSSGLATGIAAGATVVQATSGSIAASDNLTVVSAPPSSVQFLQWTAGDGGANTQETTSLPNIVTTGNLILVFAHWDNQAVTATVSDQVGNTYLPIFPATNSGASDRFQVWYAKNVTGGVALAITIAFSGTTSSYSVLDAMEYSGLDKTSPLDAVASATGSGMAQSSRSIFVPNANSEIVIGIFGYAGYALPYTAGAGFTMRGYDASTMVEDQNAVLAGTYTATANSQSPSNWAAFVMAFKISAQ